MIQKAAGRSLPDVRSANDVIDQLYSLKTATVCLKSPSELLTTPVATILYHCLYAMGNDTDDALPPGVLLDIHCLLENADNIAVYVFGR